MTKEKKKEKKIRTLDELPKKTQGKVKILFIRRQELKEIEDDLKVEKKNNTESLLQIIYDELQVDGIKVPGIGSATVLDRKPSLDDDLMKTSLKKYFKIDTVDKVLEYVKQSKEDLLRCYLKKMKMEDSAIELVVSESMKKSELSITFRPEKK